ncbi:hypothetical protein DLM75_17695 [Leptospira stimsonii]|uniref:Uncharacterized protein n=1 Tax=Leptospira stimsonii TaxID=2202203 RepID=A0A396YVT0_9LEPT|nr:hypothetical protein DLM75_17695 [Leptospira stimsonii]
MKKESTVKVVELREGEGFFRKIDFFEIFKIFDDRYCAPAYAYRAGISLRLSDYLKEVFVKMRSVSF